MEKLAIVKTTIGPLKQKVGFHEEAADESILGKLVTILEKKEDGWYLVETDYKYKGYIHESHLLIDTDRAIKWDEEANHVITWGIVDVMKEPKYQSYSIEMLTKGAVIKLTGKENDKWIEVELPTEEKGWIRENFVMGRVRPSGEIKEEELRKKVVETALSYMGTQYRWGGKTPLGIDCSGLCSISYLLNGIIIYRDAHVKEEFGMKEITMEDIKIGDMLYWPGHVAMYIGDDRYVHSTGASSGVVINSLNPKHDNYREDLAKVKQIATVF
ncbi:C40 family peptidase [Tissierella sp. MSJ-40]|uniref:C40 family peptidase n=1 Tax=Tissierella simiarum TaxID=2841534 RepID=A0ABS6E4M0_9FIRM|nr:SH3 domain-containing C40 family peptidase [Tissierella simiarum]MBU5437395.1 C40 family peptidase [Tissierella simiarum]